VFGSVTPGTAPGGLVAGHDCGAAVPLGSKEELVPRLARVLERYVDDRELRLRHSRSAYQRAIQHFAWDAKARKVLEVYEWVTGRRSSKPVFGETSAPPKSAPQGAAAANAAEEYVA